MEFLLKQILEENNIKESKAVTNTLSKLSGNKKIINLQNTISDTKNQILKIFYMYKQKEDFKEKHIVVTNANAKKEYEFIFDLQEFPDIVIKEIRNLDSIGLQFDRENNKIYGNPLVASTIDLHIIFFHKSDENLTEDTKVIQFIVNADPKDLWQNNASDKNTIYAKEDEEKYKGVFLDKKIVIASKRGRSHAHEGSFRDDHFCTESLSDGWSIITLADGAGSAKFAREGSKIATEKIVECFNNEDILHSLSSSVVSYFLDNDVKLQIEETDNRIECNDVDLSSEITIPESSIETSGSEADTILQDGTTEQTVEPIDLTEHKETPTIDYAKQGHLHLESKKIIVNTLYQSVLNVFKTLKTLADDTKVNIKDFNTTLIFVLVKKFDFGYVLLSFGVGDCPINIISKEQDDVKLLNILDVGEFGGGTRFVTMGEIFSDQKFADRFGIHCFKDFSKLILMTDGIYDPKFVTENKLQNLSTWQTFLDDLEGNNEDKIKVDFTDDTNIDSQLLSWMDFWSKGNHDDRTLAIIY